MLYKTLKRELDIKKFKTYLNQNNFICIFDVDVNSIDQFKAFLNNNQIKFIKINSSQLSFVKEYKELTNVLSGDTILISLDSITEDTRKKFLLTLIDTNKQNSFLKGIILENRIFRSSSIKQLLDLHSNIKSDLTRLIYFSLKRVNHVLTNAKK